VRRRVEIPPVALAKIRVMFNFSAKPCPQRALSEREADGAVPAQRVRGRRFPVCGCRPCRRERRCPGCRRPQAAQDAGRAASQAAADANALRLAPTIRSLRNKGVWSFSETAGESNALGIEPIRGTAWWPATARSLVQRIDRLNAEIEALSMALAVAA
jgi:hypothetical protein